MVSLLVLFSDLERGPRRLGVHVFFQLRPKQVRFLGLREARNQLRHLLDGALAGQHTVIRVDGQERAVLTPTDWHQHPETVCSALDNPGGGV